MWDLVISSIRFKKSPIAAQSDGWKKNNNPMLIKESIIKCRFAEDLDQEQCVVLMKAINRFSI